MIIPSRIQRVISFMLLVSIFSTPLGVLAQEVESSPVSFDTPTAAVESETPVVDTTPSVSESPKSEVGLGLFGVWPICIRVL